MTKILAAGADDLAALMVLSAQTWVELPPETRRDFEDELAKSHDLWLFKVSAQLPDEGQFLPYLRLLESALTERVGVPIHVKVTHWEKQWMWAEIPIGGQMIRIGFTLDRLGVHPMLALMDNRTTLLAGISHDLRTPLARLGLGLEMMPENANPELIARMERDMEEMNRLIGGFLELAQGLGQEEKRAVAPVALRRILSNLIENALRYGGGTEARLTIPV